jgi:hypothetical protein
MCGHFTQNYTWEPPRNLQPHYNIAPTDTVDVFRLSKDGTQPIRAFCKPLEAGPASIATWTRNDCCQPQTKRNRR